MASRQKTHLIASGSHIMSSIKPTTLDGSVLSDTQQSAALLGLPNAGFSKAEFGKALVRQGYSAARDGDIVRRAMQHLKQSGLIDYDPQKQLWHLTALGQIQFPQKTQPLPKSVATSSSKINPAQSAVLQTNPWLDRVRLMLSAVACGALIIALISLNASFAWELGREAAQFQIALVAGLMALDLMRPFLIAAGFRLIYQRKRFMAASAFAIALTLSPLSVLSTTAIVSSSFLLGAEMNDNEASQLLTLKILRAEHAEIVENVARSQKDWLAECNRGGCGVRAAAIESELISLRAKAQEALERIIALTNNTSTTSELIARMVTTFQALGLFDEQRTYLLPLFLALSLELGALFGPALLLRR